MQARSRRQTAASSSVERRRVTGRHRLVRNSYTSRKKKSEAETIGRSISAADETEVVMSISLILLIIVILLLIGALPTWGYSSGWGYWPSGGLGIVLLVVIILMVMGRI
jgi:hypothetical protein